MAQQKVWVGSSGPLLFDGADQYPEEGDTETIVGMRTTSRVKHADATEDGDSINKGQMDSSYYISKSFSWFMS